MFCHSQVTKLLCLLSLMYVMKTIPEKAEETGRTYCGEEGEQ